MHNSQEPRIHMDLLPAPSREEGGVMCAALVCARSLPTLLLVHVHMRRHSERTERRQAACACQNDCADLRRFRSCVARRLGDAGASVLTGLTALTSLGAGGCRMRAEEPSALDVLRNLRKGGGWIRKARASNCILPGHEQKPLLCWPTRLG